MNRNTERRLYNVLFPIWFFYLFPTVVWGVILPANFLIDSVVLLWAAKRLGLAVPQRRALWRRSILPVWLIGFFSDAVGAGLIFALTLLWTNLDLPGSLYWFPGTTLVSVPGVLAAGLLIYRLDRWALRRRGLAEQTAHRLSLALAVFTAPYTMLLPLYG